MRNHACTAIFIGALITCSCLGGTAYAQIAPVTTTVGAAAVPTPFSSAKTAFLGFGGAASSAANGLGKDLPATLYQHSFKAIADTGRYRMVGSPAEADLCMAVSLETLTYGVTDLTEVPLRSHSCGSQFQIARHMLCSGLWKRKYRRISSSITQISNSHRQLQSWLLT